MKKRYLLSLIVPLCTLSGCSYRGEAKPLRDGDLLLRGEYVVRADSFEQIDAHIKANDTFCVYFSLENCDACELFEHGFKNVVSENKILTFHLERPSQYSDIQNLFNAYIDFATDTYPSFFLVQGTKVEPFSYYSIDSESRLRNTLKRSVSLVDNYFFEATGVDFALALTKANLESATLIELDFASSVQVEKYKTIKQEKTGPLFVHQKVGLADVEVSQITK